MNLNFSTVRTLFRSEWRMLLRDRRTLIVSVVMPLLVMPIVLFSSSWTTHRRERALRQMVYHYAVTGSESNAVRSIMAKARAQFAGGKSARGTNTFHFEERESTNALGALHDGNIQLVLEGLTVAEAREKELETARKKPPESRADGKQNPDPDNNTSPQKILTPSLSHPMGGRRPSEGSGESPNAPKARTRADKSGEPLVPGAPVVRIVYRADRDDSSSAMRRLSDALQELRGAERIALLKSHGFPVNPEKLATVTANNLATEGQVAGLTLGRFVTAFVMLFMLAGGAVVATDSLVGEKERGTLETLLTSAATRTEIVAAKHLLVLAVAILITLIQAANLLLYVGLKWIPVSSNFAAAVTLPIAGLLFVLFLPLAALTTSVLLLTSSRAKSYKEAQLYFYPVCLLILTPALASVMPGLPLHSAVVLVPVADIALAAKEVLIGTFDWPMIVIAWIATAAFAAWTTRQSVLSLSSESLVTAADSDAIQFSGGPALFQRHVLVWFAMLWGLLLIISNYMAEADIRIQIVINLVVLFFGATLIMLRRYGLNPREALALRAPKPFIWPAILIAAPSGLIAGEGLFKLVNVFIPIPAQTVEAFSESVIPKGVPMWELLFFLAIMPGIFEEITFRGMLLHGLHRKLRPPALVLTVGITFGFFHVALFRMAPTAFLGVLLAIVVLETGSIFPAMLWHALNNALSVLASQYELHLDDLPAWGYLAGTVILACAFWIIWRNRTPYPNLRPWRRTNPELNANGRH